jgi:phage terminase large subunit-like protein
MQLESRRKRRKRTMNDDSWMFPEGGTPEGQGASGKTAPARRERDTESVPFTIGHFLEWLDECRLTLEDDSPFVPEAFQLEILADVLGPVREGWFVIPEGNAKTTLMAAAALYGADNASAPWIPVGASSRDQAEIMFGQASGFVVRSSVLRERFRVHDGYRKIKSLRNGGQGIKVYPYDPKTGDGVIPFPFAFVDEVHRHPDLRLYRLWKGKLGKRGGRIRAVSTAGEPGSEFEEMRELIRNDATSRSRDGCHLRAVGPNIVYHEWQVPTLEQARDVEVVKAANPLESITIRDLSAKLGSSTLDFGEDWLRLTCNIPTRSALAAIPEAEWDALETDEEIPVGEMIGLGVDFGWKFDTTALVPLWMPDPSYRLFGEPQILVPPRDGTMLSVDDVKAAFELIQSRNPIEVAAMDVSRAQDVAQWAADELGINVVIDRPQDNQYQIEDYDSWMEGMRNESIRHNGNRVFRRHVLNAIARKLPGDKYRFDRPSTSRNTAAGRQDRRVIDALTAAAMIHHTMAGDESSAPMIEVLA